MGMADGPAILPVINPGAREGLTVSIIVDPRMVLESFRRGWHGTYAEAEAQYNAAKADTEEYCQCAITDEERMYARQNLAKLALLLFAARTKAVSEAHKQTLDHRGGDRRPPLGEGEADPKQMTDSELDAYIAEQKRRIEG